MDLKNIHQSKTVRGILIGIAVVVAVLLIFQAGVSLGFRRAAFSGRLGDNYYRAFGGGHRDVGPGMMMGGFPGAHGAVGRVVKVSLPTFVVAGPDNLEKEILTNDKTEVRRFRETASTTDLKADDFVVVLGTPNDAGQVEAKLIRLLPPPPAR